MPDILIQFHALPQELLELSKKVADEHRLHTTAVRFSPFEAVEVSASDLDRLGESDSNYDELYFTLASPVTAVRNSLEFFDTNPDSLRLGLSKVSESGLRQAMLSARTKNPDALAAWKDVAKRLKKMTRAGVITRNPDTGATVYNRSFRYSAGAKALSARGVPMLPVGGGNVIEFPQTPGAM